MTKICDEDGLTAPYWAVLSYCVPSRTSLVELDSLIPIIELLPKRRANIHDADKYGRSAMHYAHRRNAQDLLIKHAKRLEEKGLDGAVQALLRMMHYSDRTPLDVMKSISPDDIPYLGKSIGRGYST